ncbi:hypothetical protein MW887_005555 [Aspergillus wentii]|nr:hypothetical protein MW887_005555 [Aspergillus wentii]
MVYGQIARYMDDCKCCYGILTTYNQTICLRRETMFTFLASPVLYHSQSSASGPNGEVDARYPLTELLASYSPEACNEHGWYSNL